MGFTPVRQIILRDVGSDSSTPIEETLDDYAFIFRELAVCTPEQRDLETGINFEELKSKKWSHSEILLTSQIEEKMIKHSISTGQGLKTGFDPAALQAKALEDGGKSTCGFHDDKCMLCFAFTLNSALNVYAVPAIDGYKLMALVNVPRRPLTLGHTLVSSSSSSSSSSSGSASIAGRLYSCSGKSGAWIQKQTKVCLILAI